MHPPFRNARRRPAIGRTGHFRGRPERPRRTRQSTRVFKERERVGIGPKDFARSVRLQRALRRSAITKDWTRVAADAGYYDQAHLIADFRELVGLTPGAFLRRADDRSVPFASRDCAAA